MFNFKKSFVALAGVVLFIWMLATSLSLTGRGQSEKVGGPPQFGPRMFYLTRTEHKGDAALSACADGYHMAALWEIFEPSNLKYDLERGLTPLDSGSGPPTGTSGWIRTGYGSSGVNAPPGQATCQLWASHSNEDAGTIVHLPTAWDFNNVTVISPWQAFLGSCGVDFHVWCVQD
jgi:hypothetical protein